MDPHKDKKIKKNKKTKNQVEKLSQMVLAKCFKMKRKIKLKNK